MGNSPQQYRDKCEIFFDGELEVFALIACDIIKDQKEFSKLQAFTELWSHAWQTGPGCIDLLLDDLLQTDGDRQIFFKLLAKMAEREGDEISELYLNGLLDWSYFRGGYPLFMHLHTVMLFEWLVFDTFTLPWLPTSCVSEVTTRDGIYVTEIEHYLKYQSSESFLGYPIIKDETNGSPRYRNQDGTRRIRTGRSDVTLEIFSPGSVFPQASNRLPFTAGYNGTKL